MPRYGMVIDLKRCIGCYSCLVACKAEHNVPNEINLTAVLEKEVGKYPTLTRLFIPVLCNHCEKPICVEVCPTRATYVREDGIVIIDSNLCIGCKACIEACPYDMRSRVYESRILFSDKKTSFENPVFKRPLPGTAIKCDFCVHRIEKGVKPACVEVCLTGARAFGDLSDSDSDIHKLIARNYSFQLLTEKGTQPCTYYIA